MNNEKRYQLRVQTNGFPETSYFYDDFEEALNLFLTGGYWKLSWTAPSGKRVRMVRLYDDNICINWVDEVIEEVKRHYKEKNERRFI